MITHPADNAQRWAELPVPEGATADDWSAWADEPHDFDTDGIGRSVEWSRHDAGGVGVVIDGVQFADGRVSKAISLYDTDRGLSVSDARDLAAALVTAADELERLQ